MPRIVVLFFFLVCLSSSIALGQQNAVQIKGIKDKITIRRDERGIPYIEAQNDEDLYFGQGYATAQDRKSTRLNSSHPSISYAVFCLKKKKKKTNKNYPTKNRVSYKRRKNTLKMPTTYN